MESDLAKLGFSDAEVVAYMSRLVAAQETGEDADPLQALA